MNELEFARRPPRRRALADEAVAIARLDPAAARVLRLQRSAGNHAVGGVLARALQVTNVDFNPESGRFTQSAVDGRALATQIRRSALNDVLNGEERQRLDKLGQQNLQGADVPALATAIIGYLAGNKAPRNRAITAQQTVLEDIIGTVATTKANDREARAFNVVKGMATSMSRAKGTANVVQWANASPDLQGAVTTVANLVRGRNNYLDNLPGYAAGDAATGSTGRANHSADSVRSAHQNRAAWLVQHVVPDPEPALDLVARNWLAQVVAHGTPLEQAEINQHFPGGPPYNATSQDVEDSALSQALRHQYLTGPFAAAVPTRLARIKLGWSRYANGFMAGCPYIEFTAEDAGGVSRFIWDYVNDHFYANTHYNWVDGFNPFFRVTGAPVTH
jgi:hypothetical protein